MQAALFRMRPVRYPSCRRVCRMKSLQVQRGYICLPNLCLHYVELNNKDNKQDRRTMAIIRHMRRSAVSAGRPGGLIREIAWKAGESELICLHGGLRLCHIGRMAKNIFETVITRKSPFISLTKLYARFCRYIRYTHIRQVMKCSQ